jgi:hypothetical protein
MKQIDTDKMIKDCYNIVKTVKMIINVLEKKFSHILIFKILTYIYEPNYFIDIIDKYFILHNSYEYKKKYKKKIEYKFINNECFEQNILDKHILIHKNKCFSLPENIKEIFKK